MKEIKKGDRKDSEDNQHFPFLSLTPYALGGYKIKKYRNYIIEILNLANEEEREIQEM